MTRVGGAVALIVALVVALAQPAHAEVPAGSTRSVIATVSPDSAAPTVTIEGGDEYVRLTAPANHELVVAGYSGEPYLRFRGDGTVEQNDRSPAAALNADRYGTADISAYDVHADPQWSRVASGGTYQWHDHRIHSMVTAPLPPAADGTLFDWSIPITVDGASGEIRGTLVQESTGFGWLWIVAVVLLTVGAVVAGRRDSLRAARTTAVVAAAAATLAMVGERLAVGGLLVGGAEALVPVALAVVAAIATLAVRRPTHQLIAAGAVPIVLSGWLLTRATVLWQPVVVSWWSTVVQRGLIVVAMGGAVATAVLALEVWRRQLSRPRVSRRAA